MLASRQTLATLLAMLQHARHLTPPFRVHPPSVRSPSSNTNHHVLPVSGIAAPGTWTPTSARHACLTSDTCTAPLQHTLPHVNTHTPSWGPAFSHARMHAQANHTCVSLAGLKPACLVAAPYPTLSCSHNLLLTTCCSKKEHPTPSSCGRRNGSMQWTRSANNRCENPGPMHACTAAPESRQPPPHTPHKHYPQPTT
jgi:hypothetical protein